MQKRFGQNFMISPHARTKLAEAMDIKEGEKVWEIGAGLGALTAELLNRGANVTVFEIDRGFIGALRELFARFISAGRLRIVEGDVMKSAKRKEESLLLEKKEIKIFGNLPYNIAASFIASTIEDEVIFKKGVFTVQKEVASRLVAKEGSKDYSPLSLLCSLFYEITSMGTLSPACFFPKPNVISESVLFEKKEKPNIDTKKLAAFLHLIFHSRRKTLQNNLLSVYKKEEITEILEERGIDPLSRAEELSAEEIFYLYEKFTG